MREGIVKDYVLDWLRQLQSYPSLLPTKVLVQHQQFFKLLDASVDK